MRLPSALIILLFALSFLSCVPSSGAQANDAASLRLTCFPIASPSTPKDKLALNEFAGSTKHWIKGASCDQMCAAQGAACTSVDVQGGFFSCATPAQIAVCRCCAIAR